MLEDIASSISLFGKTTFIPYSTMGETLNEIKYNVCDNVEVLSSYYGNLQKKDPMQALEAQVSSDVMEGDMLILFISSSGGEHKTLPNGFQKIANTSKKGGKLALLSAYKIWHHNDPLIFDIPKESKNLSVSLLTIRGPLFVMDAKSRIDTCNSLRGEAISPRVETHENGALLTAFCYADPHAVTIRRQKTLVSLKSQDDGIAVGISKSDGGLSKRIHACAQEILAGSGDDIAMAVSIY